MSAATLPQKSKPSSDRRRAAKKNPTTYLIQFPPAIRPRHIHPSTDEHRVALAEYAARTLAPIVEAWPPPHLPAEARRRLTDWTYDLGSTIEDSSRHDVLVEALQEAWPLTIMEINVWMRGRWSTRTSLNEWLWRIEVSPHAITAADWLWTVGNETMSIIRRDPWQS